MRHVKLRLGIALSFFFSLALASLSPAFGTVLFSDSFEIWPNASWATSISVGGSITQAQGAKDGSYCINCTVPANALTGQFAYVQHQLSSLTTAYVRIYFKVSTLPAINTEYTLLDIRGVLANPGAFAWVVLHTDSSGSYLNAEWRDSTANLTQAHKLTATVVATTWYCLEVYVNVGVTGSVKYWVDGNLQYTVTSVNNTDWAGVNYVQTGERWASYPVIVHSIMIDAVAIGDSYIDPIGGSVTGPVCQITSVGIPTTATLNTKTHFSITLKNIGDGTGEIAVSLTNHGANTLYITYSGTEYTVSPNGVIKLSQTGVTVPVGSTFTPQADIRIPINGTYTLSLQASHLGTTGDISDGSPLAGTVTTTTGGQPPLLLIGIGVVAVAGATYWITKPQHGARHHFRR